MDRMARAGNFPPCGFPQGAPRPVATGDPSLAFVKVGVIDMRLVGGSALFGVGWGLGGFCPGPGIVSLAGHGREALVFTVTMLFGLVCFQFFQGTRKPISQ